MILLLLLVPALAAQEADLAERLRQGGWAAVAELAGQPERKPDLEALAENGDEELRWWAGAALAEMDARRTGAPDEGARRVTLEARERPAHEILSELLAPDQLRLAGDLKAAEKPVTVQVRDLPVFQALEEVCRAADCTLHRKPDGTLEVRAGPGKTGRPTLYAGPLAVTVTRRTFLSIAEFREPPRHELELGLDVRTDPRIWIRTRNVEWTFVSAKDDTGKVLAVLPLNGWSSSSGEQPASFSLRPTVSAPASAAKSIASLRGIATLQISNAREELVFDDVLSSAGQTRQAGGLKITLRSFDFQDRKYTALLDYDPKDFPGAPELDSLFLLDAKGRPFLTRGGASGNGGVLAQFDGSQPGREPARLRMEVLTGLHPRKVYFELRDIPLR